MLLPPPTVKPQETPTSIWWIDQDGIVNIVSKPSPSDESVATISTRLKEYEKTSHGKKVCMLFDISQAKFQETSKEYREVIARMFEQTTKSMAIIAPTVLNKMMVNVFFNMKKPSYTYSVFDDEKSAREWLKQQCS